ncbi:MAG TPA: NAD(P)-binding domain-containing protein [Firmicutes bacterium]|nr:NAD(P)-binding domain-containing protein [Bacillota bacterium]
MLRVHLSPSKVAVIGGGNGARAFAGHLALKGAQVRLGSSLPGELNGIAAAGGVTLEGAVTGFGPVEVTGDDFARALEGAALILVVVPAFAHRDIARALAPHLVDGQTVILNPGRTGGALEFAHVLKAAGCRAQVHLAETQTLLYACRAVGASGVSVKGVKHAVTLAAFPAAGTSAVLAALEPYFTEFKPAPTVLDTSLMNIGAVFHPATVLLNAGRVEAGEDFEFYRDGMTPAVTAVLERIDAERVAVAQSLGARVLTAKEWLAAVYDARGATLHEALLSNSAYHEIKAPTSLKVRYLLEDLPTGLVPIASLGAVAGVPTPVCRAVVELGNAALGADFWHSGRTAENLGLSGLDRAGLRTYLETGRKGS